MNAYYDTRAPEYDDWYCGLGGGMPLHEGRWFLGVSSARPS